MSGALEKNSFIFPNSKVFIQTQNYRQIMCDYGGQTMLLPVFETNMKNTVTYCFQENTKKSNLQINLCKYIICSHVICIFQFFILQRHFIPCLLLSYFVYSTTIGANDGKFTLNFNYEVVSKMQS